MIPGVFNFDDDGNDIVTLSPTDPEQIAVTGWINIGEHAVKLTLDPLGGLSVECHAKAQEGHVLALVQVPRLAATLCRLRAGHDDKADPMSVFVGELGRLGFDADGPISGADTVDTVARHYDNLRMLSDPRAMANGEGE